VPVVNRRVRLEGHAAIIAQPSSNRHTLAP
jgi:hypothetical protein